MNGTAHDYINDCINDQSIYIYIYMYSLLYREEELNIISTRYFLLFILYVYKMKINKICSSNLFHAKFTRIIRAKVFSLL